MHSITLVEQSHSQSHFDLLAQLAYLSSPTMDSNSSQGNDNSRGNDNSQEKGAVWGGISSRRKQDTVGSNMRSPHSLISPASKSDNWWSRSSPESPSDPASAAGQDPPDSDYILAPQRTSRLNPTGRQAYSAIGLRQQHAPVSVGAASRSHAFNGRQKSTSSYMKQSCLPVDERDPDLLHAEQNRGRVLAKEVFKLGMIIRAALHEPLLSGATDLTDKNKGSSIYGPVFSKVRKMIVVALYEDHYIALPVYTHNGNGLQGKTKADEYVSVKDHRSQTPFTPLSKHLPLVTETVNPGIDPFHPNATAHLTYPVSRKYNLRVTPEGILDTNSVKKLIALFNDYMPRAPQV